MADATFRTRTTLALAVAGALGLSTSPMMAATAFAAPTIQILQPGVGDERTNNSQVTGCSFHVRLDGAEEGSYRITFQSQQPTGDIPNLQGDPAFVVGKDRAAVTHTYLLLATEGVEAPKEGFHIKATVAVNGDNANVGHTDFWVKECSPGTTVAAKTAPQEPAEELAADQAATEKSVAEKAAPEARGAELHADDADRSKQATEDSVPATVNSGIDGGNGGVVALGLGGVAVAGLAAFGLRKRLRG